MNRAIGCKINSLGFTALMTYSAFMVWRLFFYAYSQNYRQQMADISYNLVPFKTIINYLSNSDRISFDIYIYNLVGNVAAFMPLGFLLPIAFKGLRMGTTLLAAFVLILSAEAAQLLSRRGVFDVDDLLLNIIGSAIGYLVFRIMNKVLNYRR